MSKTLTLLEIAQESIDYYKDLTKRSVDKNDACVYNGLDNKVCAFSRVIKPEFRNMLTEGINANTLLYEEIIEKEHFLSQYAEHSENQEFWIFIQKHHDFSNNDKEFEKESESLLRKVKAMM